MDKMRFEEICELIQQMREVAEALYEKGRGVQAVERNTDRILANVRMLELNMNDLRDII